MESKPSQSPKSFTFSPFLVANLPTPIAFSPQEIDFSQWTQFSSSNLDHSQPSANGIRHDSTTGENSEGSRALDQSIADQSKTPGARKPRYADLDWEGHRDKLHELYIQEGLTLLETREIMRTRFDFIAPAKTYKEKFKYWRFQKNLPGEVAQWMVQRASEREDVGKKTQFEYRGQQWSPEQAFNSAYRTKKQGVELVETPSDMIVATPEDERTAVQSGNRHEVEPPQSSSAVHPNPVTVPAGKVLPLNYNGKTVEDLKGTLRAARNFAQRGEHARAEEAYIDVFHGLELLLSPAAEDTTKIGYELASFYWQRGRKIDADALLESMSTKHINQFGMEHRSTQQHVLDVAGLLNSWNRGDDALMFLRRAADTARAENPFSKTRSRKRNRVQIVGSTNLSADERLQSLSTDIANSFNATIVDHGLTTARLYAAVNEPAIETLLKAIERQCMRSPAALAVQGLKARAELLKNYVKKDRHIAPEDRGAFETAPGMMRMFWNHTTWDREEFRSHEIVEASLELAAGVLRGAFLIPAQWMFEEIERTLYSVFGIDDQRTIWALINIGIIYQTCRTWNDASRWFGSARAAAHSLWGTKDGIYRSLEKAFEKRHFSYVNDEGRPFETVFGVSSLVIRPTRLHLE